VARRPRLRHHGVEGSGSVTWVLIRASGLVAYGLLSGAAIWGLIVASGLLGRTASAKRLTYVHESLSVGSIVATVVHVVLLRLDDYVEFGWDEILLPGQSEWRPVAVSFGVLAFYGLVLITASFYVRRVIGQRSWRGLHYASFGLWVAGAAHGLLSGTDRGTPLGVALYAASGAAVIGLVMVRVVKLGEGRGRTERPRPGRDDRTSETTVVPGMQPVTDPE